MRIHCSLSRPVIVLVLALGLVLPPGAAQGILDVGPPMPPVWEQVNKFSPEGGDEDGEAEGDLIDRYFGSAVEIDGDLMVVGSAFDPCSSAGAHVYEQEAGTWQHQVRLHPQDPASFSGDGCRGFGNDVAVDAETRTVVVGDPGYGTDAQKDAGAAYVYQEVDGEWVQTARFRVNLTGDDQGGEHGPKFGEDVATDGDRLAIAAPHAQDSQGVIVVYRRTTTGWAEEVRLADLTQPNAHLGEPEIQGDTLVAGAGNVEKVLSFERTSDGWSHEQTLRSPPNDGLPRPDTGTCFGFSLALHEETLAVGEPCWKTAEEAWGGLLYSGRVDVYTRSATGWQLETKLTSGEPTPGEDFGKDVALADGLLVAGAPFSPSGVGPAAMGAAYVFAEDGGDWERQTRLVANDTSPPDEFGFAVGAYPNGVAVGAPRDDNRRDGAPEVVNDDGSLPPPYGTSGFRAGSVYVFAPMDDPLRTPTPDRS